MEDHSILRYTEPQKISNHLWLQHILSGNTFEKNSRWSIHLIIDELTNIKEIESLWHVVERTRNELTSVQGTDPNIFWVSLMNKLSEYKKGGVSYGDLAKDMNFDALCYLLWLADKEKGEKETLAGMIFFTNLLSAYGFNDKDIEEWEKHGRKSISKGKAPWGLSNGPITGKKVTRAFDKYKYNLEKNNVVIPPLYNNDQIENAWLFALGRGYWKKASELFQKSFPDDFKGYYKRYQTRLFEINQFPFRKTSINSG